MESSSVSPITYVISLQLGLSNVHFSQHLLPVCLPIKLQIRPNCKSLCDSRARSHQCLTYRERNVVLHTARHLFSTLPAVELVHAFCTTSAFSSNSTVWFIHIY